MTYIQLNVFARSAPYRRPRGYRVAEAPTGVASSYLFLTFVVVRIGKGSVSYVY